MMVATVLSALAGFLVFMFGALWLIGSVWPTLSYESALPVLIAIGMAGAVAAVVLLRRRRAKMSSNAP
jgi:hypothetical protein